MTTTDLAYTMLAVALGAERPAPVLPTDRWWALFKLMQQNHVAALCCQVAVQWQLPREVLVPWLAEAEKATAWHRHQAAVQAQVVALMQQHGIDTLVLKGTATAQHYPVPHLREFGDIDLYFYNNHSAADQLAASVLGVDIENDRHHHTKYNYRGVTIESHYRLLNPHYPRSNRQYNRLLQQYIGSATFQVLFLLRHMACHFASSRITLRDVCDWALTCRALQQQADWAVVQRAADQYGMHRFAAAIADLARQRLDIDVPMAGGEAEDCQRLEADALYGSPQAQEHEREDLGRLLWKVRRWRAMRWKRRMVFAEPEAALAVATLASHLAKPSSILHKM